MIVKYNGIWDVYVIADEYEPILDVLSVIKSKDEKALTFTDEAERRIKEACYKPQIIKWADYGESPKYTKEEKELLKNIEVSREKLFDDLIGIGKKALDDNVISGETFGWFEAIVSEAKEKVKKRE